jgi:hypothetical protein
MPNGNVLDTGVLFTNFRYHSFQAVGKCLSLGLELDPAVLELAITPVVDRLPVVINDEIRDVNTVFGKCCHSFKNFLFGESLSQPIPRAYDLISRLSRIFQNTTTYSKSDHHTNSRPIVLLPRHPLSGPQIPFVVLQ